MFCNLARKIDAEEIVRVNLRLCQDLVNSTRLVASCRPGGREHHRWTQPKRSAGQPARDHTIRTVFKLADEWGGVTSWLLSIAPTQRKHHASRNFLRSLRSHDGPKSSSPSAAHD